MGGLGQVIWTVVAITLSVGRVPAMEDDSFIFTATENDKFPTTNFVPTKLRISDAVYDRLMVHLGDQLSAEDVDIPLNDYFPKEVESDEGDELEFVHEYDLDDDDDDADNDVDEFKRNLPNDASVSADFGKRDFKFAKVLVITKGGKKTFSKFRQSAKTGGHATSSATGNYNTSLDVTTSASGNFNVNSTYFSKGKHQTVVASGTVVTSSSSKSKVEKRRLFQHASADSSITVQIPSLVHVNSSVRSGSETLKLPFRSYLTLFRAEANTTADNILKLKASVAGEVISRVAFANKTVSLTKSCIKAYVKSKAVDNTTITDAYSQESADDDDDNAATSQKLFQVSLIKAKSHTWTKVVSQSKTEVVVDVITCTKTRIYGKSVKKGAFVIYTGSGQVSWDKSKITIVAQRVHNLSPHEYGVHFIKKQLEGSSLIQFLGNSFEVAM
ncbi:uncharacterized protein LOC119082310 [Bradysia coprophila]|uniref:uncharacterized protein LOC119082310 n=1 Tax=Bradysia coprophila TaxID=38358 RepID=UPI00187D9C17|nr:uncharacterized protein LOC119082310 [Bradysia coprophila]